MKYEWDTAIFTKKHIVEWMKIGADRFGCGCLLEVQDAMVYIPHAWNFNVDFINMLHYVLYIKYIAETRH